MQIFAKNNNFAFSDQNPFEWCKNVSNFTANFFLIIILLCE